MEEFISCYFRNQAMKGKKLDHSKPRKTLIRVIKWPSLVECSRSTSHIDVPYKHQVRDSKLGRGETETRPYIGLSLAKVSLSPVRSYQVPLSPSTIVLSKLRLWSRQDRDVT